MTIRIVDGVLITTALLVVLLPQELSVSNDFLVGCLMLLWLRTSSLALSFRWDTLPNENGQ
jgi:hypothetical protein